MVYFRCTSSGSGKGNTVIVTCAEQFAGVAITIAKIGKSYTKVCPLSAPYVVKFYGVEAGTYTVSATVSGQTYSAEVIVQDVSCVLNYGFTWKTWVDTASQLDSTDYASLSEVLADEEAVRELFLEHACVDYMADSTNSNADLETIIDNDLCAKWINNSDYALDYLGANVVIKALMNTADKYGYGEWCLMPQVPKMTSNTAPYGEASASNEGGSNAYKAFDGDKSTSWATTNGTQYTQNSWIQYKFNNPIKCNQMYFMGGDTTNFPTSYKIEASNDGTNWDELYVNNNNNKNEDTVRFSNNNYYMYYRLFIVSITSPTDRARIAELQFYAYAPKGNVPVMTANNAPYGTASASTEYSADYAAWKAFNGIENTQWSTSQNATSNCYLRYKFTNPVCVRRVKIGNSDSARSIKNFKVRYSNDGTNFTELPNTYTNSDVARANNYYDIDNNVYALYWDIYILNNYGDSYLYVRSLQFYGRSLSVSVPTMTSNTAPFGEAIASSIGMDGSEGAIWRAFDNNNSTYWHNNRGVDVGGNSWIGYKFGKKIAPKMLVYSSRHYSSERIPKQIKLQGSDDYSTWNDIESFIPSDTGNTLQYFAVSENMAYKALRAFLVAKDGITDYNKDVQTLQFYGLDYSEKEFEAGTTKKWLYDHGVFLDSEVMSTANGWTAYNGTSVTTFTAPTVEDSEVYMASDTVCGIGCKQSINLSDYSHLFAKVAGKTINSGSYGQLGVYSAKNNSNSTRLGYISLTEAKPSQIGLDISAQNTNAYCEFFVANSRAAWLNEFWLE